MKQSLPTTPDDMRTTPKDLEMELTILGSMMMSHRYCEQALAQLTEDDFYSVFHQHIFNACRACGERDPIAVDVNTVKAELETRETLEAVGGLAYLKRAAGEYMTAAHAPAHIRILRERTALREAMFLAGNIRNAAEARPDDVAALLADAAAKFEALHDRTLSSTTPGFTTAAEAAVHDGEESWLWHPWIPNGYLTLVAGESGIGKSKFGLRIMESVVTPSRWPDGAAGPEAPGVVFHLDTEGTYPMQRRRMREAGLPMDRVMQPLNDEHIPLDDPATVLKVRKWCEQGGVNFLLIDSLRSGMSGDENSSEFGEKLQPWSALARDLNIAVVIIHHANKGNGDREMHTDRIRGSSAITALPRSIIVIDKPNEAVEELRVKQIKNNLDVFGKPFGLRTTQTGVEKATLPHPPRHDFRAAEAEEWLYEQLRRGPVSSGEVRTRAEEAGIANGTLYKARDTIGVVQLPDGEDPRKRLWALRARPEDAGEV